MKSPRQPSLARVVGKLPYRLALAGGWIDQPFVSRLNPHPPGSMVVVNIHPDARFMDRSGLATGTRNVARRLWKWALPRKSPEALVRALYDAENRGRPEPSGSQDMIGLLYPGINRLDYDFSVHGGVFPAHIESIHAPSIAQWLQSVLYLLPVAPRPEGYTPLEIKRLNPRWIGRLGRTGMECFDSIQSRDVRRLGASFNECMRCWTTILPGTMRHPTLTVDLLALLRHYQALYPGAMYSGCGGGYLFVASEKPVPAALQIRIRLAP